MSSNPYRAALVSCDTKSARDVGGALRGRRAPLAVDARHGVGVDLVERLALEQRLGEGVELLAVVADEPPVSPRVLLVDDPAYLLVDQLLGRLRTTAGAGQRGALAVPRRQP